VTRDGLSDGTPGWDPMVAEEEIEVSVDLSDFEDEAEGTDGPLRCADRGRSDGRAAHLPLLPARRRRRRRVSSFKG
jgi:hypothetical protein